MKLKGHHGSLLVMGMLITLVSIGLTKKFKGYGWMNLIGVSIGFCMYFVQYPLHTQVEEVVGKTDFIGTIVEGKQNTDNAHYIIDQVVYIEKEKDYPVKFKLQVQVPRGKNYRVGDVVAVKGKGEMLTGPLNPSDMDYSLYLRGKGVGATIRAMKVEKIGVVNKPLYELKQQLSKKINDVFKGKDHGLVTSILLGDKKDLNTEIKTLYNALGIGHILAISGLHVGIIYGMLWWVTGQLRMNAIARQLSIGLMLWGYCLMTGASLSAIRATTMLTFILIAKIFWHEADLWVAIGWTIIGIILINPYSVFQVGFQLSFVAYTGILISSQWLYKLRIEEKVTKCTYRWIKYIGPPLFISLLISPILAYHFYQVPVLANIFNLFIATVIECMIPLMVLTLFLAEISLSLAQHLAGGICLIFDGITVLGSWVIKLPYATCVIGQPTIYSMMLYYGVILIGVGNLLSDHYRAYRLMGCCLIGALCLNPFLGRRNLMRTTHLYVGQGDSTVIETPNRKVIVIDGGPKGKGKTVKRYLHYRGYDQIELAIVTHAHDDHISGIIEMIEEGIKINRVCMPKMPQNESLANQLIRLCKQAQIPLVMPEQGGVVAIGDVGVNFYRYNGQGDTTDLNTFSAVMCIAYKDYQALYTGDLPMTYEYSWCKDVGDIDVLKVGHHGSDTSTSYNLLEATKPEYGVISCGINNRYNHPSPLVIERLQAYNVEMLKTYEDGAITMETDGKAVMIKTQYRRQQE